MAPSLIVALALVLEATASWQAAPAPAAPLTIVRHARALQPGEVVALDVTSANPVRDLTVRAFGRDWLPFPVDDHTWRVLIGIDLGTEPGTYRVICAGRAGDATFEQTHRLAVVAKSFPTRRLTVAEEYVEPPPDVLARIQREAARLAELWADSPVRLWSDAFIRPVPQEANSAFGSRSVFNGQARSPHGGADFRSPAGTPIASPNAGRVTLAEDLYYTGQTVVVDHGLGLVSLFAHLSRIDVAEGDRVAPGQVVGLVGSTGRVTGPHLHWTLRLGGARVDPLSLLAVLGGETKR